MKNTDDKVTKSPAELRRFGLALGAGLTVLGSILFWREKSAAPWILGVAATLLLLAILAPRVLGPLEKVFARVARVVTAALTYLVLTLTFFLVITPLGLVMRLLGRDPLAKKPAPDQSSFWVEVEPDGPTTRPHKPY
ncbi:MAG: SxtJ family membrane protein [Thermoanaerobaculia bacterium]